MKNKIILIISPEAWGNNYVSKHHYAKYLSKNNTVYFLNPVYKSTFFPFKKIDVSVISKTKNLHIISYTNVIPRLNSMPKKIQEHFYQKMAAQNARAPDGSVSLKSRCHLIGVSFKIQGSPN